MDSDFYKSGSKRGCKDHKGKTTVGWLERLPPSVVQGILRSRNESQKTESKSSDFSKILVPDIIQTILLRVSVTYVVQYSLICRPFRNVASSQSFALMHLKHGSDNSPFLIFHHKFRIGIAIPDYLSLLNFDSLDGYVGKVRRIDVPFKGLMPDYSIIGSCYGYLCLFDVSHKEYNKWGDVCLSDIRLNESNKLDSVNDVLDINVGKQGLIYNPLTAHFKELPQPSQGIHKLFAYGFGFHVETGEYKVLMAGYCITGCNSGLLEAEYESGRKTFEVQILTIGTSAWRALQTPSCWLFEDKASYMHKRRGLWVSGSLYWMTSKEVSVSEAGEVFREGQQIIAFNLATEEFREITLPRGTSDLLVVRGNLSAIVDCTQESWELWVLIDCVKGSWSKIFIMGHYMPAVLRHCDSSSDNSNGNISENSMKVVCCLKNGKFLMQYGYKAWCFYDPETELYEDLTLRDLPVDFDTISHVGSLNLIEAGT